MSLIYKLEGPLNYNYIFGNLIGTSFINRSLFGQIK